MLDNDGKTYYLLICASCAKALYDSSCGEPFDARLNHCPFCGRKLKLEIVKKPLP